MADYSIGDRVEVRWQAELFDAAVTEVHPSGKVDVRYDIDGSAGIFLTAKKYGLKLLGDEEKKGEEGRRRRRCPRRCHGPWEPKREEGKYRSCPSAFFC